jgi:hypothetical protein
MALGSGVKGGRVGHFFSLKLAYGTLDYISLVLKTRH